MQLLWQPLHWNPRNREILAAATPPTSPSCNNSALVPIWWNSFGTDRRRWLHILDTTYVHSPLRVDSKCRTLDISIMTARGAGLSSPSPESKFFWFFEPQTNNKERPYFYGNKQHNSTWNRAKKVKNSTSSFFSSFTQMSRNSDIFFTRFPFHYRDYEANRSSSSSSLEDDAYGARSQTWNTADAPALRHPSAVTAIHFNHN